jgi:hypothetical protein
LLSVSYIFYTANIWNFDAKSQDVTEDNSIGNFLNSEGAVKYRGAGQMSLPSADGSRRQPASDLRPLVRTSDWRATTQAKEFFFGLRCWAKISDKIKV